MTVSKGGGRLYDGIKGTKGCDAGHDAEVQLSTEIGEIREDLLRFGLGSHDTTDGETSR